MDLQKLDTTYGKIGVKVWMYNGEVLPTRNGVNPREERRDNRRNDRRDNKRNDRRNDNRRYDNRGTDNRGTNNRGAASARPQGQRPQGSSRPQQRTENKGN